MWRPCRGIYLEQERSHRQAGPGQETIQAEAEDTERDRNMKVQDVGNPKKATVKVKPMIMK
jgi:hypothetical protein